MNIGIIYDSFERLTGIQSVIVNCISEIKKIDRTNKYYAAGGVSKFIDLPHVSHEKILIDNSILMGMDLYEKDIKILHSYYPAFENKFNGVNYLITVHDLIAYVHPEWFPDGRKEYFDGPIRKSVEMSERVFAVSEATKADIVNIYGIKPEKIEVVYNGLHGRFDFDDNGTDLLNRIGIEGEYILSACTIEPRKNLRGLIKAFISYKEDSKNSDLKLVLAGGNGWDKGFREWVESLGFYNKDIIALGYVSDIDLSELYRKAISIAYVSFYEGFGLPVLEGMAAGKAVICSNTSSMPEVGGDAVSYCNPYDVDSIADSIKKVVENETYRKKLEEIAKTRANKFSYSNAAKQIIGVYNSLR